MKTKTIADIVREMRENKGIPVPFAPTNAVWIDDFKAYADRIEAAHKREVAERETVDIESRAIYGEVRELGAEPLQDSCKQTLQGNGAKIRKALETALYDLESHGCDETTYEYLNERFGDGERDSLPVKLHKQYKEALAAPPRNCDLYPTQFQMSEAYEKYRKSAMEKRGSGIAGDVPFIEPPPMSYDEWMFATITN